MPVYPAWRVLRPSSNLRGRRKRALVTIAVVLLTLRIPVVDLRPFCMSGYPQGVRLPATWSEDTDFVRYFGPVTRRLRGPIDPWTSERVFCQFDGALRFPPSYHALLAREFPDLQFFGTKRRLYPATARNDLFHADVQVAGRSTSFSRETGSRFRRYAAARLDLVAIVNAILGVPTTVRLADGTVKAQQLARIGPPMARALDAATTVGGASGKVAAGAPAIAIEIEDRDSISATWLAAWDVGCGLRLAARTVIVGGRRVNVCVVARSRQANRYQARALRIHLLRLHSEREYLRQLTRLMAVEDFVEKCERPQLERLQDGLNQCLGLLTRAGSHGYSRPEIMAAFLADRTLSGSELEDLIDRVGTFRPILGKRLRRLGDLDDAEEAQWRAVLGQNPGLANHIYLVGNMTQYDQRGSQIGAAGDHASAANFTFGGQVHLATMTPVDAEALTSALQTLRKHLADHLVTDSVVDIGSEQVSPVEIGSAIGALSEAEEAITAKDEQRIKNALRRSGRWLMTFAEQVGVALAAAAIASALTP